MKTVHPEVYVVGRTGFDPTGMDDYLQAAGGAEWLEKLGWCEEHETFECDVHPAAHSEFDLPSEQEALVEFAGRLCYRSWKPGLNPNISKVREDHAAYLRNILVQRHGSVLEHVSYSFVFANVSRVLTHELVRHRPGVAISQESMRYVRLDDLPFWFPQWAREDVELYEHATDLLARMEWFQQWMTRRFGLDEPGTSFAAKKAATSFMRRFAPEGVATSIMWTANLRTLRWCIEARTSPAAEEEIRFVFGKVARIMTTELPALFGDFALNTDTGAWVPGWSKV